MNEILEKLCEMREEENPNFDRNNPEDIDKVTKCFVVSQDNDKITESYLREVVAEGQKRRMKAKIAELGNETVEYELKILKLEKDIIEKQIEITKEFLN